VSFDRDFRKLLKRSQFTLLSPAYATLAKVASALGLVVEQLRR